MKVRHYLKRNTLPLIVCFLLLQDFAFAQTESSEEKKDFNFVPVPYISYNRTYDFMFGAVPMVMYKLNKKDTISPASLSGVMGVYTTNKSWFTGAFSKLYLKEDTWRITAGFGFGNINAQFLQSGPIEQFINYQTGADFAKAEVQRKIGQGLYLGLNYLYTKFDNEYAFEDPVEEEITLHGIGAVFLWDKRDDVYYPRIGHKLNFEYTTYPSFMNDEVSNQMSLKYNKYFSKRNEQDVWVVRGYAGFGLGDVAFNNLLVMGGTDLRGYSQGEYRGKQLIAAQTEYRYNFKDKMGLIAFGGVGTVYESDIESNNGKILPSIGIGYRYLAFPKNKMNVGLDVAAGRGDWGVYFRIGESF